MATRGEPVQEFYSIGEVCTLTDLKRFFEFCVSDLDHIWAAVPRWYDLPEQVGMNLNETMPANSKLPSGSSCDSGQGG